TARPRSRAAMPTTAGRCGRNRPELIGNRQSGRGLSKSSPRLPIAYAHQLRPGSMLDRQLGRLEPDRKGRTLAELAAQAELAAHLIDRALADRQPQARQRTDRQIGLAVRHMLKRLEDRGLLGRRKHQPGILNVDLQLARAGAL